MAEQHETQLDRKDHQISQLRSQLDDQAASAAGHAELVAKVEANRVQIHDQAIKLAKMLDKFRELSSQNEHLRRATLAAERDRDEARLDQKAANERVIALDEMQVLPPTTPHRLARLTQRPPSPAAAIRSRPKFTP